MKEIGKQKKKRERRIKNNKKATGSLSAQLRIQPAAQESKPNRYLHLPLLSH
jgi:hypothetical protein